MLLYCMQQEELICFLHPHSLLFVFVYVCVCVPADVMEGKSAILLGMSQWNSNDLVEQIETLGHMEHQSHGTHTRTHALLAYTSIMGVQSVCDWVMLISVCRWDALWSCIKSTRVWKNVISSYWGVMTDLTLTLCWVGPKHVNVLA